MAGAPIYSKHVTCLAPDRPLLEVAECMTEQRLSCLVLTEGRRPVGIISERDLCTVLARLRFESKQEIESLTASDVMTSPVITVRSDARPAQMARLMQTEGVRRLVVVDRDGHLEGIVTQSDLVNLLNREHEVFEARLSEEVWRRTNHLGEARRRLVSEAEFKSDFLTQTLQDLQSLVLAIRGRLEQLEGVAGDETSALSDQACFDRLNASLKELAYLAELEVEPDAFSIGRASPFAIHEDLEAELRRRCEGRSIEVDSEIEGELPEYVNTDVGLVRSALTSLMARSISSMESGRLSLRTRTRSLSGTSGPPRNRLEIELLDTGRGFEESELDALTGSSPLGALGSPQAGEAELALYEAGHGLRCLGARLVVDNWPGEGARVLVTMMAPSVTESHQLSYQDYQRSDEARLHRGAREARSLPALRAHAIVADAVPANRLVLERMLRRSHLTVESVTDADSLAERLLAFEAGAAVDVLLLDSKLPGGDAAVRIIREAEHPPVIIAVHDAGDEAGARDHQCRGYDAALCRPIDRRSLLETMARLIGEAKDEGSQPCADASAEDLELTLLQKDALGEVLNLGLGAAAAALSSMVGDEVLLSVPEVEFVAPDVLDDRFAGRERRREVAVQQLFTGSLEGEALLLLSGGSILDFMGSALPEALPEELYDELERDLVSEIGNIVLGACMSAFTDHLDLDLAPHLPRVQHFMPRIEPSGDPAAATKQLLLVAIDFKIRDREVHGYLGFALGVRDSRTLIDRVDAFLEAAGLQGALLEE